MIGCGCVQESNASGPVVAKPVPGGSIAGQAGYNFERATSGQRGADRARPGAGTRPRKTSLFLLAGAGFLGGPEGNSSAHRLLLDRGRSTAELARDLAGRSSRLGELLQGTQFTGAPGGAIVRRTLCHWSFSNRPRRAFCGSYPAMLTGARPTWCIDML